MNKIKKSGKAYGLINIIVGMMILSTPLLFGEEITKGLGESVVFPDLGIRRIKEYGMLLLVFLSVVFSIKHQNANKAYGLLPVLVSILLIVLINSSDVPLSIILCGMRWALPFFLPVFLYEFVDGKMMACCYKTYTAIFFIHIASQIAELFLMPHYGGDTYFGLAARVPGITPHPHASAYFSCLYYFLLIIVEKRRLYKRIGTIAIALSLVLAMSSTGVLAFAIMFMMNYFRDSPHWKKIIVLGPFVALILVVNLDTLTNRKEGSSEQSMEGRTEYLSKVLKHTTLISENFGYATNGALHADR